MSSREIWLPYMNRGPRGVPDALQDVAKGAKAGTEADRRLEVASLRLLGLGLLIGMFMVSSAPVATSKPPLLATLSIALLLIVTFYIANAWVRRAMPNADRVMLVAVFALMALGVIFMWRLEPSLKLVDPLNNYDGVALKHTLFTLGSLTMLIFGWRLRHLTSLKRYKYVAFAAGLLLVTATMFFGTGTASGIKLWFQLGIFSFQPSELLKVLLVIWLAGYMDDKRYLLSTSLRLGSLRLPPLPYLVPMIGLWLVTLVLFVVERDLGSALLFYGIFLVMLYVVSGKKRNVLAGLGFFASMVVIAFTFFPNMVTVATQRYEIWLNPWTTSGDDGHQIVQALFTLAAGGVLGTGLGYGQPYWVPAVHTDMIITAIGEELGLAGVFVVLCLLAIIIYRGLRIALHAPWGFEQLLAVGLTTVIGLQSLVIVGGATKLIPLTGVTLPFVSYGGSSMLINCLILALLLRVSDASHNPSLNAPASDSWETPAPNTSDSPVPSATPTHDDGWDVPKA